AFRHAHKARTWMNAINSLRHTDNISGALFVACVQLGCDVPAQPLSPVMCSYETLNKRWNDLTGSELERRFARSSLFDEVEPTHETVDLDDDITDLGDVASLLEQARAENVSARSRIS